MILLLPVLAGLVLAEGLTQRGARPDGVARVVDLGERFVIFEGVQATEYGELPDGRVWLFDRDSGRTRLLTQPVDFGERFFASGGVLTPNEESVIVKVNFDDDPGNLYAISTGTGIAHYLTDATELQLAEILEHTLQVSPDGSELAFSAYREQSTPTSFEWVLGVYTLPLGEGSHPAQLERSAAAGSFIYPVYGSDGSLQVVQEPDPGGAGEGGTNAAG